MTNSNLSIRVIGVLLVVLTPLYAPFGRSFAREKTPIRVFFLSTVTIRIKGGDTECRAGAKERRRATPACRSVARRSVPRRDPSPFTHAARGAFSVAEGDPKTNTATHFFAYKSKFYLHTKN